MLWILIAFISPITHGFANVLDNYLTNKLFKNVWTLIFYSTSFTTLFIPLVLLVEIPGLPPVNFLPLFLVISLINVFYLYPYYKALQSDDTSIISALFSLGRIFVPILAFLFVGEILEFKQYLGFFIIILGSAVLTLNSHGSLKFNKSLFYMTICSILLAIEVVIYKYIFENVSWSTGFVWTTLFSTIIVLFFLFYPKARRDVGLEMKNLKNNLKIFTLEELLSFLGSAGATYAIFLAPVTLVKGIASFQPIFVLIYAILLSKLFPHLFREKIDRRSIVKKILLFIIMVIGIILII